MCEGGGEERQSIVQRRKGLWVEVSSTKKKRRRGRIKKIQQASNRVSATKTKKWSAIGQTVYPLEENRKRRGTIAAREGLE